MPTTLAQLHHRATPVIIAPSVLSADLASLEADCLTLLDPPGAPPGYAPPELIHLDVMDGHFVPNLTMGPALCESLRRGLDRRGFDRVVLDVHLMVDRPAMFFGPFARAGAGLLTYHIEAATKASPAPAALLAEWRGLVRELGCSVGLAINPPTPLGAMLGDREVREQGAACDMILAMTVNPGFAGQAFIADVLEKVRGIRRAFGPAMRIQVDGGVSPANAAACRDAGADVLVAASAIFGKPVADRPGVVAMLRG